MIDQTALPQLVERDFLTPDAAGQADLERRIDLYFNTPLDIFPYSETTHKPRRFYDFYELSIAERFPDDEDIRSVISRFTRGFFHSLVAYVFGKRGMLLAALLAITFVVLEGMQIAASMPLNAAGQMATVAAAIAAVYGLWAGVNAIIFVQYRINLENRSYALSRQIIQRTRALQNLYASVRAMPDQQETQYQSDGEGWGERSSYLLRLLMWLGARMEYLEKYIQVEMWRVRRERYWMDWAGGILVVLVGLAWVIPMIFLRVPAGVEAVFFHGLQVLGIAVGIGLCVSSYLFWKTPLNLARDKLGADSWVRYATLDLDNTIGDQVRRDKRRLVEYRTLNKGF
ncbi:hypothetical protein BH11PSE2_BH11PSE2_07980 [soil metagenome]